MRQIGTLPSVEEAQRFEDYLLTRGIKAKTEADTEAWTVWVYNEDDLDESRQALANFQENPKSEQFTNAQKAATDIRDREQTKAKKARKNVVDVRQKWQRPLASRCPVTFGLIAVSVIVFIGSDMANEHEPILNALSIASYRQVGEDLSWMPNFLQEVRHGEVWRLVTPIFIHFTILHILFNMLWLRDLGSVIEFRHGSLKFTLMILALAISSNVGQFIASGGPFFGGMSGVVFGLFGYIWIRGKFDPNSGFFMPQNLVFFMIAFFFLCTTGMVGQIANTAHGVGLVMGMMMGYAPTLWRNLQGR